MMQTPAMENKGALYPRVRQIELVYIGEGRTVGNVPARDLDPREVMFYGGSIYLKRTGLYAEPDAIKLDG